ncbi:MAG: hypothetical protein Q4D05_04350, partial [Acinetobacter sp.]|nr:hypothetical protein [Acinetobacter sp.]
DELLGFNPQQMWLLVAICLCSVLFLYVGMKLRAYLSLSLFKQLIYLVLFLLSIKTAYSGVMMLG